MNRFIIIEIDDAEIGSCVLTAFKYMVEDTETGSKWYGSNSYQDCIDYIQNYAPANAD